MIAVARSSQYKLNMIFQKVRTKPLWQETAPSFVLQVPQRGDSVGFGISTRLSREWLIAQFMDEICHLCVVIIIIKQTLKAIVSCKIKYVVQGAPTFFPPRVTLTKSMWP